MGAVVITSMGLFLLLRGTKEKTSFPSVTGIITYLDKTHAQRPMRRDVKHRYLSLDSYSKTFEVFIGKDPGDFSPAFERLDDLQPGDEVTAYFDEDPKEKYSELNLLLQFLDKSGEPYYIRGNKDKYGGIFFIGFGIVLAISFFLLKKAGSII